MKKLLVLISVALVVVVACQKEGDVATPTNAENQLSKNFNLKDKSSSREVGNIITKSEANAMKESYMTFMKKTGLDESKITKSSFYGINTFEKLLSQKDCVGIRFSYGMAWQDDNGNPTPQGKGNQVLHLILISVDKNGNELVMDLPASRKSDDGYAGFDHGALCPVHCN
jgi:hypothetical protein